MIAIVIFVIGTFVGVAEGCGRMVTDADAVKEVEPIAANLQPGFFCSRQQTIPVAYCLW